LHIFLVIESKRGMGSKPSAFNYDDKGISLW